MRNISAVLIGIIAVLVVASLGVFTVDQRQNAIVFRLGEIISIKKEPGLYFKVPILDNVRFFETRILTLESPEPERFLTSEKKNVLVDSFVKWRIVDVKQYYISVGGDEQRAQLRLAQTVNSSLRDEFGNRTVHDVVSGERDRIMELMREKANEDAQKIGVQVMDVRIKRVDLPQEVSESVCRRMEAERKRVANELRSTGAAESEKYAQMRTASAKSFSPKPTARRSASRARAMPKPRRSMARPISRTRSFTLFTVAWKPTGKVSRLKMTCWCWTPIRSSLNT